VSLGNDVVDLGDPETRLDSLHPRFAERAFTPAERAALEASGDRPLLHWALWAAKESAFKAVRRLEPRTVFSPRRFAVDLPVLPAEGGTAVGRVRHGGESLALEVSRRGDVLHAVAWLPSGQNAWFRCELDVATGDPGLAARRLAARAIGAALGLDPDEVRVVGRPPVATRGDRPLDAVVSLSHHGRFAAFAALSGVSGAADLPGSSRSAILALH
jgi:phosphopantetheinyl transferase (holo-ACP synthase)